MGRPSNSLSFTQYLGANDMAPEEFDNIDDLFLADLFNYNEENLDFFKQESIQRIIDRQFSRTAKVIKRLLVIYSIGFVIPQVIQIFLKLNK